MAKQIIVLGGGDSPERKISLQSADSVTRALKSAGYEPGFHDPSSGLEFLNELSKDSVVLPILHGAGGEDGTIQAELEKRQLRFLGTESTASRICFDKVQTRAVLGQHNIPIARGLVVSRGAYASSELAHEPHILKVARGGSSIGTLFVREPERVDERKVDEIFQLDDKVLLEELVEGVEITVPILDDTALPVIEIQPPEDGNFDFLNKYNGKTQELCPPQSLDQGVQRAAQRIAEKVHEVTGCRHISRVDMIVRPDGSIVVLEINTIPGMTSESLYPKSAAVAGFSMTKLVEQFVEMAERI